MTKRHDPYPAAASAADAPAGPGRVLPVLVWGLTDRCTAAIRAVGDPAGNRASVAVDLVAADNRLLASLEVTVVWEPFLACKAVPSTGIAELAARAAHAAVARDPLLRNLSFTVAADYWSARVAIAGDLRDAALADSGVQPIWREP